MAKPNYQHARRQKELARKARQQDKQQRRARETAAPEGVSAPAEGSAPSNPGSKPSA